MSEYQLAYADNSADLAEVVTSMMADGWTPQGGVSVTLDRDFESMLEFHYYQAMVRLDTAKAAPDCSKADRFNALFEQAKAGTGPFFGDWLDAALAALREPAPASA